MTMEGIPGLIIGEISGVEMWRSCGISLSYRQNLSGTGWNWYKKYYVLRSRRMALKFVDLGGLTVILACKRDQFFELYAYYAICKRSSWEIIFEMNKIRFLEWVPIWTSAQVLLQLILSQKRPGERSCFSLTTFEEVSGVASPDNDKSIQLDCLRCSWCRCAIRASLALGGFIATVLRVWKKGFAG